jgi:hypothetical protein
LRSAATVCCGLACVNTQRLLTRADASNCAKNWTATGTLAAVALGKP